ncbi:MAG TPA: hypothetical protein PLZ16_00370 [Gammaproteobacteria bacterium]|nr:hypothetical protein [Gammaproteobacteria bacterium]
MRVTMQDVRAAGMCGSGACKFFRRHKLDWWGFKKSGIEAEKLIATGDAMALHVVEVARGRR